MSPRALAAALLLTLGVWCAAAPAQQADPPTPEEVRARIEALQADQSVPAEERDAVLAALRSAAEALQRRQVALAEAATRREQAATAPTQRDELRARLDKPPPEPELDVGRQTPLEEVTRRVESARADLAAAQAELAELQAEAALRTTYAQEAPQRLAELRARLADIRGQREAVAGDGRLPSARRLALDAEASAVAARIEAIEAQLASYDAREEVLPLRRSIANRRIDLLNATLQRLQDLETTIRRNQAEQAEREAQQRLSQATREAALRLPQLREIAERTAELAADRTGPEGVVARLDDVRQRRTRAAETLRSLRERARSTAAKIRATGLTDAASLLLRNEREKLPTIDPDASGRLERQIGEAQYELITVEEELAQFGDVPAAVATLMGSAPEHLEPEVRDVVESYAQTLRSLRNEYDAFIEAAADLDATLKSLDKATEAFRTFIEERILWTRSVPAKRLVPQADELWSAAGWLAGTPQAAAAFPDQPNAWADALRRAWPPSADVVALALAAALSLWGRRRARLLLAQVAAGVRRFSSDRFALTLAAIPLTLAMALPVPLGLLLGSAVLDGGGGVADAVADGLASAAGIALALSLIRQAARPDGLADAHFRWRREGLVDLRRLVLALMAPLLPLVVVIIAFREQPEATLNDAAGRVVYVAAMLLLAVFFAVALSAKRPFVGSHVARRPGSLVARTRWLWRPALVATPLALAALAIAGYYYTATQLGARWMQSVWLIVGVAAIHATVLRWLFVERRHLVVERARLKREAADDPEVSESEAERELDAADIDAQTRRVVLAAIVVGVALGLYALWASQLPALRMLERVQIWPAVTLIERQPRADLLGPQFAAAMADAPAALAPSDAAPTAQPGGAAQDAPPDAGQPVALGLPGLNGGGSSAPLGVITLADVLAAAVILGMTWVLARNLPGLLEITVLKRLPLDAGSRFAVSAILRYVLGIVGILAGFAAMGVGWSQVQWLAAALTFGLAFGLQEIFANFISGLIILAERPVRVGDTVTVNGTNGTVTRIRMRATTVQDWRMRELVIPNKVFITDQFVNWTLSDSHIRVEVPVGVAYGSDVRLVERTLLELAQTQPHVAASPAPRSLFLAFGDSSLTFELRVYLDHFDHYLDVKSQLHTRVAERFQELGIEIAFPQRDLHVRSIGPLADALAPAARAQPDNSHRPAPA